MEENFSEWLHDGINMLCCSGDWFLGNAIETVVAPYSKTFQCVYILTHERYPDAIKIGITKNLRIRMREYKSSFRAMPVLVAVIKTDHAFLLETLLKNKFCKSCLHGEWFAKEPVLHWVESWSA